jgi:L-ribulose-5-phosphate 4-epimerase
MLEELKARVCQANLDLVRHGLVVSTWGNASAVDRASGLVVIKPSGVPYEELAAKHFVVVSLASGQVEEGSLRPSSDTATHLALYRAFVGIGGIVHTHSLYATAWAQARREIPALGTTHADYFHGPVPVTREIEPSEIKQDYEANTGRVIIERFLKLNPLANPAVLVACHGPFAWGTDVGQAVETAVALEYTARLALETLRADPAARPIRSALLDKHFHRKHGPAAYYGQPSPPPNHPIP